MVITLDQDIAKTVKGCWTLSERFLLLKIALDLNIILIYASTLSSSDEDTEQFYEDLEQAGVQCRQQVCLIIMGDFNAKVGEGKEENVVGPHGLGIRNIRREKIS